MFRQTFSTKYTSFYAKKNLPDFNYTALRKFLPEILKIVHCIVCFNKPIHEFNVGQAWSLNDKFPCDKLSGLKALLLKKLHRI